MNVTTLVAIIHHDVPTRPFFSSTLFISTSTFFFLLLSFFLSFFSWYIHTFFFSYVPFFFLLGTETIAFPAVSSFCRWGGFAGNRTHVPGVLLVNEQSASWWMEWQGDANWEWRRKMGVGWKPLVEPAPFTGTNAILILPIYFTTPTTHFRWPFFFVCFVLFFTSFQISFVFPFSYFLTFFWLSFFLRFVFLIQSFQS